MRIKKLCLLLAAVVMLSYMSACGEAGKVEKLISAIGYVTADSGYAIEAAQSAFDALASEDKAKVDNAGMLKDAHSDYELACKAKAYEDGRAAFAEGAFDKAKEFFEAAGDYEDAQVFITQSVSAGYYANGQELMEDGSYSKAVESFVQSGGYSDADTKIFECGKNLLLEGNYSMAYKAFSQTLDSFAAAYSEYAQAMSAMETEEFDSAAEHFAAAGDIEDAADMVLVSKFLQAESCMEQGYLNTAKTLYSELPEGYSYEGRGTAEPLAALERHKDFVELCGVWYCDDMYSEVRSTYRSTGSWDSWYVEKGGYTVEVTCVINADDTVSMVADAELWHYTNFSTLSTNLNFKNENIKFLYTGTKPPYIMDDWTRSLDPSFNHNYSASLTLQNDGLKLKCTIVDDSTSVYFRYTYDTSGVYDSLSKAW